MIGVESVEKEQRKKKKRKIKLIFALIAITYFALAVFHYFAIVYDSPRAEMLPSILSAATEVFTNPLHMKVTVNGLLIIGAGIGIAALFIWVSEANKEYFRYDDPDIIYDHFMKMDEWRAYNEKYTDPLGSQEFNGKKNMIITRDLMLMMDNAKTKKNFHVLIFGGSGAGKTRYFAAPNIRQFNCNFIITDPSGELLGAYGKALENNGYDVKVFNLVDVYKGNRYNPFHYIKSEKDVYILTDTLFANTTIPGKGGGDQFWDDSAKMLLNALILYIWHMCSEEKDRTFQNVMNLLNMADVDENNPDTESPLDSLFAELEKEDENNLAVREYHSLKQAAGKTMKSVLISLSSRLRSFKLSDIQYLTSTDEFHFESFSDTKQALFVILPTADDTFNFLASLMYSQLFITLFNYVENTAKYGWQIKKSDGETIKVIQAYDDKSSAAANKKAQAFIKNVQEGTKIFHDKKKLLYKVYTKDKKTLLGWRGTPEEAKKLQHELSSLSIEKMPQKDGGISPCLNHARFILDEFANIGAIPQFDKRLSTIRKYEISCSIILQSLSQLKRMYKDEYTNIISNCDTLLYLGTNDSETNEWFSKLLGDKPIKVRNTSQSSNGGGSSSFNNTKAPLMPVSKLRLMPSNECIAVVRQAPPFYGKKYDLLDHPNFKYANSVAGQFYIPTNAAAYDDHNLPFHERQRRREMELDALEKDTASPGSLAEKAKNIKKNLKEKAEKEAEKAAEEKDERASDAVDNSIREKESKAAKKALEEREALDDQAASMSAEESLMAAMNVNKESEAETIKEELLSVFAMEDPPEESLYYIET